PGFNPDAHRRWIQDWRSQSCLPYVAGVDATLTDFHDGSCHSTLKHSREELVNGVHAIYSTHGRWICELRRLHDQPAHRQYQDRNHADDSFSGHILLHTNPLHLSSYYHRSRTCDFDEISIPASRTKGANA